MASEVVRDILWLTWYLFSEASSMSTKCNIQPDGTPYGWNQISLFLCQMLHKIINSSNVVTLSEMGSREIPGSNFIISGPSVQRGAGRALQDRQADGETLQTGKEEEARSFRFSSCVVKKGETTPHSEKERGCNKSLKWLDAFRRNWDILKWRVDAINFDICTRHVLILCFPNKCG